MTSVISQLVSWFFHGPSQSIPNINKSDTKSQPTRRSLTHSRSTVQGENQSLSERRSTRVLFILPFFSLTSPPRLLPLASLPQLLPEPQMRHACFYFRVLQIPLATPFFPWGPDGHVACFPTSVVLFLNVSIVKRPFFISPCETGALDSCWVFSLPELCSHCAYHPYDS